MLPEDFAFVLLWPEFFNNNICGRCRAQFDMFSLWIL